MISFLVTCKNEGQQVFKLLYLLNLYLKENDDCEIIILDDFWVSFSFLIVQEVFVLKVLDSLIFLKITVQSPNLAQHQKSIV